MRLSDRQNTSNLQFCYTCDLNLVDSHGQAEGA